jgi:hypothetical protein
MELENIVLSEVNQAQKVKSFCICSPSYADYRPKTIEVTLRDMGHTKGRLCKGGIVQGKETKNLDEVDVLTVQE